MVALVLALRKNGPAGEVQLISIIRGTIRGRERRWKQMEMRRRLEIEAKPIHKSKGCERYVFVNRYTSTESSILRANDVENQKLLNEIN